MNEPGPSETRPSPMSDEELIREIERWGERPCSHRAVSAIAVKRQANEKSRRTFQAAIVACTVIATAVLSITWFTQVRRPNSSQAEIAVKKSPNPQELEFLLKSIERRTQEVELLSESLNASLVQERQAAREIQELNASLLNLRRVAIRNAIILNQIP